MCDGKKRDFIDEILKRKIYIKITNYFLASNL